MTDSELSNEQLSRYSRHLLLPEIDLEGQQRLAAAHAVIIGAGGLGSPTAMYLASSGMGKITIIDHDTVDLGNLQRQIAFKNSDIGKYKAEQLGTAVRLINPEIETQVICRRAEDDLLSTCVSQADIVLDCCDNFTTRFAVNQACLEHQTPLVSGAAIRFQGQVAVFDPRDEASPCYRCLYHEDAEIVEETCRDRGIFAPLVGVIGSIQAAETLKMVCNIGRPLTGRLLSIDALTMTPRLANLPKDPHCPACGG
jgi:molybdopterin/thiamine biosynthesis adenylyltransferase